MIFFIVFLGYLCAEEVSMKQEKLENRIQNARVIQNLIKAKKRDLIYIAPNQKKQIETILFRRFHLLKDPLPESLQHLKLWFSSSKCISLTHYFSSHFVNFLIKWIPICTNFLYKQDYWMSLGIVININPAIAPWFHLRLPSCSPGFESQAHHLCF